MDDVDDPLTSQPEELVASEILNLFKGELNPVAPKAQKKVPVPDG